MLRVGLTGGLACGKSAIAKMMADRGAQVIEADAIARDLMRPGQPVYEAVVKHFGREIVNQHGEINRATLAKIVFGGSRVEELNRLVHPEVIKRQEQWMDEVGRKSPTAIAVVEAALIVEAGVNRRFDKMIVVKCSEQQKVERYTSRLANAAATLDFDELAATAEARKRIGAQLSDDDKLKIADFVIDNSGSLAQTEQQIDFVMKKLRVLAAEKISGEK